MTGLAEVVPIQPPIDLEQFSIAEQLAMSKLATMVHLMDDVRPGRIIAASRELTEREKGVWIAFEVTLDRAGIPEARRHLMLDYLASGAPLVALKTFAQPM